MITYVKFCDEIRQERTHDKSFIRDYVYIVK